MVEQQPCKLKVVGSSPTPSTIPIKGFAYMYEKMGVVCFFVQFDCLCNLIWAKWAAEDRLIRVQVPAEAPRVYGPVVRHRLDVAKTRVRFTIDLPL